MQTYEKVIRCAIQMTVGMFDEDGELVGERIVPAPDRAETLYHPFDLRALINAYDRELRGEPELSNGRTRRREEVRR